MEGSISPVLTRSSPLHQTNSFLFICSWATPITNGNGACLATWSLNWYVGSMAEGISATHPPWKCLIHLKLLLCFLTDHEFASWRENERKGKWLWGNCRVRERNNQRSTTATGLANMLQVYYIRIGDTPTTFFKAPPPSRKRPPFSNFYNVNLELVHNFYWRRTTKKRAEKCTTTSLLHFVRANSITESREKLCVWEEVRRKPWISFIAPRNSSGLGWR